MRAKPIHQRDAAGIEKHWVFKGSVGTVDVYLIHGEIVMFQTGPRVHNYATWESKDTDISCFGLDQLYMWAQLTPPSYVGDGYVRAAP